MPGQVVDHKREEAEQERPGNRDCRDASSRHRIPSTVVNGHEDPLVTTTEPSVGYLRGRPRPSRSRAASESPRVGVTISLGMFGAGALLDGAAERTHRAILGCGARWFWACAPSLRARTVYTARVLRSDPGPSLCAAGRATNGSRAWRRDHRCRCSAARTPAGRPGTGSGSARTAMSARSSSRRST